MINMKAAGGQRRILMTMTFLLTLFLPEVSLAHCDAKNGPVATDARQALKTEEFNTVALWVGEEQSGELRKKFEQSLAAYRMGGDARQLAEEYFMETAVRLHREAEGFPYTGLKAAGPLPKDIALAEKALETGELEPVNELLVDSLKDETGRLFRNVLQASEKKEQSLEAGRRWADAYVKYVIYVHGLYQTIQEGPAHGIGE